jgi:hypothetical protein
MIESILAPVRAHDRHHGGQMSDRTSSKDAADAARIPLGVKVAGTVGTGVAIALALAPEALAKLAANHNETMLVED